MKHFIIIGLIVCSFGMPQSYFQAHAQNASIKINAGLRLAKRMLDNGNYEKAAKKLNQVLSIDANNAEANELLEVCNRWFEQQRLAREREELIAFDKADSIGTKASYNEFINTYPESKFVDKARNLVEEYELWQTALHANTIEGYNAYLSKSTAKLHTDEAKDGIQIIKDEEEWQNVSNSNDLAVLQRFLDNHPQSVHASEVSKRVHILKGEQYYGEGDLAQAFVEYNKAGGRTCLPNALIPHYNRAADFNDYYETDKDDEQAMLSFLASHPQSEYRNAISNAIARKKASNLSAYSTQSQFDQALNYALDSETQQYVENRIEASKQAYAQIKREERAARIKANGGYIGLGFEIFDAATNMITNKDDRFFNTVDINMALVIRVGNFKTPIYLEIGAKPGCLVYDSSENEDVIFTDYSTYKFHMPVFAKLKINLFNAWDNTKCYINGAGYYHAIREKTIEPEFSVGGGIGVAGRHWDWQILYYRQDLNKDHMFNKYDLQHLGMSLGYFF